MAARPGKTVRDAGRGPGPRVRGPGRRPNAGRVQAERLRGGGLGADLVIRAQDSRAGKRQNLSHRLIR